MWKKQEIKKVIELRNQGYNSHQISRMLGGMIQRQVSTRKPTDKWTDDLGVVSTKFFQLVEYDANETRAVYYV